MDDFWETAVGVAFIALIWWGGSAVWHWAFGNENSSSDYQSSYNSNSNSVFSSNKNCAEPENPYDYDSGHYAGWEWGAEGNDCGGNSGSFIEGCEEYQVAQDAYEQCLQ